MTSERIPQYQSHEAGNSVMISSELKKKNILFVEAISDGHLMWHLFGNKIAPISATGWKGVIEALKIINAYNTSAVASGNQRIKCLGLIDRDYGNNCEDISGLITSKYRDIEIDILETPAGERILNELGSNVKLADPRAEVNQAYTALLPIGRMRNHSSNESLRIIFNEVNFMKYYYSNGSFDLESAVSVIIQKNTSSGRDCSWVKPLLLDPFSGDVRVIIRGHDVTAVLAQWLKKKIGNHATLTPDDIESHLRVAARPDEVAHYKWSTEILQFIS